MIGKCANVQMSNLRQKSLDDFYKYSHLKTFIFSLSLHS